MCSKAWFDVAVFRCPNCGSFYVDASWYAVTLESDIECGVCHENFNAKKMLTDRVLLKFVIDENGKTNQVVIDKHFSLEEEKE
jgi:hypothetical protein